MRLLSEGVASRPEAARRGRPGPGRGVLGLLGLLGVLLLAACSPAGGASDLATRRVRVAATTGMIADAARNVGGSRVQVTGLMGPGVDPHLYKPSARDVDTLGRADIVFYGGLELEGRMADLFSRLPRAGTPAFAVAEAIPADRLMAPPEFEGRFDPHVWFDVGLWQVAVGEVAERLAALDPASADVYRQAADRYRAELDDLDRYVRERAAEVPDGARVLITAHDAFGYFGRAYGFEVRGLQGTSTATEAGAGDVVRLADFLCRRQVRAVFVESSIPRATIDAVQQAARARGCQVDVGGELFSDALGEAGSPEGTYAGMVRYNIDTIVEGLRPR
jgi:manganese/zinc/iron transport system substrate-binding protein